ncbi:MAG: hypothetical protein NT022_11680 [Deltaproteobacteria bacterium]|nr:hypothetical protein [Deltaproteobacteria bacterium]
MNISVNRSFKISLIIFFAGVSLTACGTSKSYVMDSNPKGALIIQHDKPVIEESFILNVMYRGETPTQADVRFFGSIDTYYFTAEKRGYAPSIQKVTKESDLATITFNMNRIEGVPTEIFKKENLLSGKFVLLPTDVEVIIHSGIGRMDKKKSFSETAKGQTGSDPSYLIYIWARCISETKGRKIGNIFVGTAAAARASIRPAFYYDPSAFNPDSGTMAVIYVIDANTSEVLYIEPRDFGYDITDPDDLNKVADILSKFPNIEKRNE